MGKVTASICALAATFIATGASAAQITIGDPTYATSYYESDSKNQDESLFMFGVYETSLNRGFRQHPTGNAIVNIGDQGGRSTTLVLSSYEPTLWNLVGDGVDDLTNILLFGYHDQSISGVADSTVVEEYSYEGTRNYQGMTYKYPGDGRVVRFVEAETGLTVDEFAGSYRATEFYIGESESQSDTTIPEPSTVIAMGLAVGIVSVLKKN